MSKKGFIIIATIFIELFVNNSIVSTIQVTEVTEVTEWKNIF